MTTNPELWDALLPVVDALVALEASYCIGGSVASSFAGVARATLDVDLVAELRLEHAQRLVDALAQNYYADIGIADLIDRALEEAGLAG